MSDDDLILRYVRRSPAEYGAWYVGEPGQEVPLLALIGYFGADENWRSVARDYDIAEDAVRAALAFWRRHPDNLLWGAIHTGGWCVDPDDEDAWAEELRDILERAAHDALGEDESWTRNGDGA